MTARVYLALSKNLIDAEISHIEDLKCGKDREMNGRLLSRDWKYLRQQENNLKVFNCCISI